MAGTRSKQPYHSVAIKAGPDACEAVRALRNQRVLSTEAPLLPLADCDRRDACRCVYRHFADRRGAPRRASERGAPPGRAPTERRLGRGRRETDE